MIRSQNEWKRANDWSLRHVIAAQGSGQNLILVTNNTDEFSRIKSFKTWGLERIKNRSSNNMLQQDREYAAAEQEALNGIEKTEPVKKSKKSIIGLWIWKT